MVMVTVAVKKLEDVNCYYKSILVSINYNVLSGNVLSSLTFV